MNRLRIRGFAAFIITVGVVLILFSSLGIVGSLHISVDPQILSILFLGGIVVLLAMVLRKHSDM